MFERLGSDWICLYIWDKVFKNGPSIICGRQPLKDLKGDQETSFKGYLPQILLDTFLNTLFKLLNVNFLELKAKLPGPV